MRTRWRLALSSGCPGTTVPHWPEHCPVGSGSRGRVSTTACLLNGAKFQSRKGAKQNSFKITVFRSNQQNFLCASNNRTWPANTSPGTRILIQCIRASLRCGGSMAEDMRNRILDATERLLARLGYQKTTMDDIAREAGIGKRTIYLHFPSKEEVALGSIDRIVERLKERLQTLALSGESPAERLRQMLL